MQRLLDQGGNVSQWEAPEPDNVVYLDGHTDAAQMSAEDLTVDDVVIEFAATADGRGFSLAQSLRSHKRWTGRLIASGQLIPDQVSMLFQCGFDAVLISDTQWANYGQDSWLLACDNAVSLSYSETRSVTLPSIWQQRAQATR